MSGWSYDTFPKFGKKIMCMQLQRYYCGEEAWKWGTFMIEHAFFMQMIPDLVADISSQKDIWKNVWKPSSQDLEQLSLVE